MATRRKRRTGKVLFVKSNPAKRRKRRKSNPGPVAAAPARRRRRARRANPAPRRRRSRVASFVSSVRRRARRHNPGPGSVALGSNMVDGAISLVSGGLGYFAGLLANKYVPASMIRYRGALLILVSLVGAVKVKNRHLRVGLIGLGVEGAVDMLKQNVSSFATLSADDAAEHMVLGMGSQISTQRGNPALGYEPGAGLGYEPNDETERDSMVVAGFRSDF